MVQLLDERDKKWEATFEDKVIKILDKRDANFEDKVIKVIKKFNKSKS